MYVTFRAKPKQSIKKGRNLLGMSPNVKRLKLNSIVIDKLTLTLGEEAGVWAVLASDPSGTEHSEQESHLQTISFCRTRVQLVTSYLSLFLTRDVCSGTAILPPRFKLVGADRSIKARCLAFWRWQVVLVIFYSNNPPSVTLTTAYDS